ncbi:MAG: hypothetical protein FJX76_22115 [Armatimonadetes bacterium]|nr:hypothetical protein [Armatimonadota bacterium]
MRVRKRPGAETLIILPTDANRNLGVFFIFIGITASFPLWYLWCVWFGRLPRGANDWYPAVVMASVFVLIGYILAVHSRKKITVTADAIRVKDGMFRHQLRFTWNGPPLIKLQHIDSEQIDRPRVKWLVKLVNERYEYTIDERVNQQLQSRALAEALAKTLGCPLQEKLDDGTQLSIAASDLDIPFRERVEKYPNLLGTAIDAPVSTAVKVTRENGAARYEWGVATTGAIVDVLVVGLVFVLMSAIPPSAERPSILETARGTGDFTLYFWLAGVVVLFLAVISGFRVLLSLAPDRVSLRETLWGIPISIRRIAAERVEEIQLNRTVRGPIVQIVSDEALIQFRVSDLDTAAWLTYEIRCHLAGERPTTRLESAAAPTP